MKVLGIETSCDETAASVVVDGRKILSNVVSSSLEFHKKYGGIVPEIAFRRQLETIAEVVDCAIKEAETDIKDIDLISVTKGPGLSGSLLVGLSFAKALSTSSDIPVLGVDHLYSHAFAPFLEGNDPPYPFVALIVSGGHTNLYLIRSMKNIQLLGRTQDDACGEAFDKVAKILGLGYPGGPVIEKAAQKGDPSKAKFNCSNTRNPLDFSFSGIKTAVLYHVKKHARLTRAQVNDICAGFQKSVLDVLVNKSIHCCRSKSVKNLIVGGGVAANSALRERFLSACKYSGIKVFFPEKRLSTDNAAMVAGLGYYLFKAGFRSDLSLNVALNERG